MLDYSFESNLAAFTPNMIGRDFTCTTDSSAHRPYTLTPGQMDTDALLLLSTPKGYTENWDVYLCFESPF